MGKADNPHLLISLGPTAPEWGSLDALMGGVFLQTFLDAEGVDGSVSGVGNAVLGPGFHDSPVDFEAMLPGHVQLPAHLAHEGQPHGPHLETGKRR